MTPGQHQPVMVIALIGVASIFAIASVVVLVWGVSILL